MNKKEILNKLSQLSLDKNKFIIGGESALVLLGYKRNTSIITLYVAKNYKSNDKDIIIENKYFNLDKIIEKDGYFVYKLDELYKVMLESNYDKKLMKKIKLIIDSSDNYKYERELKDTGIKYIAGVDEVGRGPLVGPVVTACVVLPEKFYLDGLTDSKKLSEKKRDYFYEEIKKQALGIGIGQCSAEEIDKYNIYEATKIAMKRAINNCLKECKIEHVLIDSMKLDIDIPTTSIIKGDLKSITISAASIIAKVTRDKLMRELDLKYPLYDFKKNVGYPTKEHIAAINEYGILKEHRKTFGPVKEYILEHGNKTIN